MRIRIISASWQIVDHQWLYHRGVPVALIDRITGAIYALRHDAPIAAIRAALER